MQKPTQLDCVNTSAHVDWLTATGRQGGGSELLWSLGTRLLDATQPENESPSRWHAHGYSGWITTGVRIGARADGTILQLSGRESADHWQEAVSTADNISRIDLAVDSEFQPPVPSLVAQLYRKIGRHNTPGRRIRRTIWANSDGGTTLYVGARSSENFGRLYDKGIERKAREGGAWWRWEVELKGSTARENAFALRQVAAAAPELEAAVASWFKARLGVGPPSFTSTIVTNVAREPSTDARSLQWLAHDVRPTVQRLLRTYGRSRILNVLGIPPSESRCFPAPAPTCAEESQWPQVAKSTRLRS